VYRLFFYIILLAISINLNAAGTLKPTYYGSSGVKETILDPHCVSCHSSTGSYPSVDLTTYELAIVKADRIKIRVGELANHPPISIYIPCITYTITKPCILLIAFNFPCGFFRCACISCEFLRSVWLYSSGIISAGQPELVC